MKIILEPSDPSKNTKKFLRLLKKYAPLLGLKDWRFILQEIDEQNTIAATACDYSGRRAAFFINRTETAMQDEYSAHATVLHELSHCLAGGMKRAAEEIVKTYNHHLKLPLPTSDLIEELALDSYCLAEENLADHLAGIFQNLVGEKNENVADSHNRRRQKKIDSSKRKNKG